MISILIAVKSCLESEASWLIITDIFFNDILKCLNGKYYKLLSRILKGASDASIRFDDLCKLLQHLGFEERIRGSHHIFRKQGVEEKINLQQIIARQNPIK
jgi:hypothetical protein